MEASKKGWTFTSDSCGFMLYLDGVAWGGARTLGTRTHTSDGRRRHPATRKADAEMHRDTARRLCDRYNLMLKEGKLPCKTHQS